MTFRIVDEPPDRAAFTPEAIAAVAGEIRRGRARLLERVAAATDADLAAGTDDDWGIGQIALHLLTVERGILGIAGRLARGEEPGPTGQPRPKSGSATRDGLASLASKAEARLAQLQAEFPAEPDLSAMARQPYYGNMNCIAWLLTIPIHYVAHRANLLRGIIRDIDVEFAFHREEDVDPVQRIDA